jgi:hypothetical protein
MGRPMAMTEQTRRRAIGALVVLAALAVAACTASPSAAPSSAGSEGLVPGLPSDAASPVGSATTVPGGTVVAPSIGPAASASGLPGTVGSPGTSSPGGTGSPGDPNAPLSTNLAPPPAAPLPSPSATLVSPQPVTGETHPVSVQGLTASVRDGHLIARLEWVSGVPPCTVLARVEVARSGSTFTLTVLEGSDVHEVACIDMAMSKATEVDLGAVSPGTYIVRATPGDAPAVTVAVP